MSVDISSMSSLYNSFIIFLSVITMLDRLSIYISLLRVEMCLLGRMVSALCFSSAVEDNSVGLIPVEPLSLWTLMSTTQIRLYVNKLKLNLRFD